MPDPPSANQQRRRHLECVLELYRRHPQTTGRVRNADRRLAADLYRNGVTVNTINAALLLVAARRCNQGHTTTPIQSLHYFLPVIREILHRPLDNGYRRYLETLIRDSSQDPDHHLL